MDISIIIPLYNEAESLTELHAWITKVMQQNGFSYEIIFIDDGSNDDSWKIIEALNHDDPHVKAIKFRRNYGKAAALNTGFEAAIGEVIITMDADLQDSPDEIPELYQMIKNQGYDLVSGWKKKRYDPPSKTIPTKLYNWATRKATHIKLHDFNCGLKAYRNEVVKAIEIYGEMHRYIPVIAKWAGFVKIGEKVVQHYPRKHGKSKYGLNRFINGFLDLISISFIGRFGKKPMHFFGLYGSLMFILGFIAVIVVGAIKIHAIINQVKAILVTDSPYFYIALVAMILGAQLFMTGFLGEIIARNSSERNNYKIEKKI